MDPASMSLCILPSIPLYLNMIDNLYKALLGRNAQDFAEQITDLLRKTISYYDSTESFYHGLISGLLSGNVYYKVDSHKGYGRKDNGGISISFPAINAV